MAKNKITDQIKYGRRKIRQQKYIQNQIQQAKELPPSLSDYTIQQLVDELKKRGCSGEVMILE